MVEVLEEVLEVAPRLEVRFLIVVTAATGTAVLLMALTADDSERCWVMVASGVLVVVERFATRLRTDAVETAGVEELLVEAMPATRLRARVETVAGVELVVTTLATSRRCAVAVTDGELLVAAKLVIRFLAIPLVATGVDVLLVAATLAAILRC